MTHKCSGSRKALIALLCLDVLVAITFTVLAYLGVVHWFIIVTPWVMSMTLFVVQRIQKTIDDQAAMAREALTRSRELAAILRVQSGLSEE